MILVPKYIPSENKLLGVWSIMDYSPIDFRKEGGENVFYLTDFVNYGSTTLVKAGTWYYDPETGYLALNAEGINALFINAMNTGYGISEPGKEGERLLGSSSRYELKRETHSETVKGTWKGEYNNWKIDLTLADDTYDEQRILYRNSAGEGGTVAKIDTSGNYEVQPNTYKMYEVEQMVSFGNDNAEGIEAIGTQKTTFQSWLVFAGGSDCIAVGGLLGSDLCILTR